MTIRVDRPGRQAPEPAPWRLTARPTQPGLCLALLLVLSWPQANAGEVRNKLRLALFAGGDAPTEEVRSNSANVLIVLDDEGVIEDRFTDPRNDAAITGTLEARPGTIQTLSLQYALTRTFLLEFRAGYRKNEVGEIEVQEVLAYRRIERVRAGTLTRTPLHLGGIARFRPEASFNPYIGGAVGYSIVDFDMSPELAALSANLEQAQGRPTVLRPESELDFLDVTIVPPRQLEGAVVQTGSAVEWQIVGGAELNLTRRWAAVVDLTYTFSEARWQVGFDGGEDLGVGVPQGTTTVGSPLTTTVYGPLQTLVGGPLDLTGDGVPDRGFYYIEGGRFRLDGFTFQVGVRYTF